jgi:dTDP-4-dehydrorhamnose reductase
MKVLVLGVNGMLGHQMALIGKELGHEVHGTTRKEFDALQWVLGRKIGTTESYEFDFTPYDVVINCIGVVKPLSNPLISIPINAWFPQLLARAIPRIKFVHISTDCVFNGDEKDYNEDSKYSATDLYGMSKALGEVIDLSNTLTVRTSIIGDEFSDWGSSRGLLDWFLNNKDGETVNGFANHFWSGLTTRELARQVYKLLDLKITGLRVVHSEAINKFDLLKLFNEHFRRKIIIKPYLASKPVFRVMFSKHDMPKVPLLNDQVKELADWCINERSDKYG